MINTLPKSEDMCWTPEGIILMARDSDLYYFDSNNHKDWIKIMSLKDYGINNITRMAVSLDSTKLTIVAEPINIQKQ